MKHRYRMLITIMVTLMLLAPLAVRAQGPAGAGGRVTLRAAGRGNPWINLSDGVALPATYTGPAALTRSLTEGQAHPLSLAAADFDEDGVPDLIAGYADCGLAIADCGLEEHPKSEIRNAVLSLSKG